MAKQVPRKEDMVTRIKKCLTQDISRFDDPRLEFGSLYEGKPQCLTFFFVPFSLLRLALMQIAFNTRSKHIDQR